MTFLQTLFPASVQGQVCANIQAVTGLVIPLSAGILRTPIALIFLATGLLILVMWRSASLLARSLVPENTSCSGH